MNIKTWEWKLPHEIKKGCILAVFSNWSRVAQKCATARIGCVIIFGYTMDETARGVKNSWPTPLSGLQSFLWETAAGHCCLGNISTRVRRAEAWIMHADAPSGQETNCLRVNGGVGSLFWGDSCRILPFPSADNWIKILAASAQARRRNLICDARADLRRENLLCFPSKMILRSVEHVSELESEYDKI